MGSRSYLLRMALHAISTLLFVVAFNFLLFRMMPSDPVQLLARSQHLSREDITEQIEALGLCVPPEGQSQCTDQARKRGYEVLPGDAWLEEPVDILMPSAIENQIRGDNAGEIAATVMLIAEGANGPTTREADAIIADKGIVLIPDFLANAGVVTCSYFEQVQSNQNMYWERDEVLGRLDVTMTAAFHAVADMARKRKLSMRDAAYVVSISRVAEACHARGWV